MIPEEIRQAVQHNFNSDIVSEKSVSGGSINKAAKIELSGGQTCFLKWNTSADPDMFIKEEKGLQLLRSAGTPLQVPEVLATGRTPDGSGFLLQEFFTEGRARSGSARDFGQALASLHGHNADQFGLDHDNYIGRLPQSNKEHSGWTDFFISERMQPQLQMAVDAGKLTKSTVERFETMYTRLPDIFPGEPPALLHGDLWGGNYFYDSEGKACIYDPAVYYGHREIELAFTHLFGGFSSDFYRAYEEAMPAKPGFSRRKDIYNLYPLLVHTNLFGGSYARQVKAIVKRF